MQWQKLGQIFEFDCIDDYLLTHAANPVAVPLDGSKFRIFFSGRDNSNRSSVGFADLDMNNLKITKVSEKAVFTYSSDPNSFYSHGVSVGCHTQITGQQIILFMGWHIPDGKHWEGQIGSLQLSNDMESLKIYGEQPFMGKSLHDPVSLSYPWILSNKQQYKMWYGSTITWQCDNGEMLHVIKQATSADGSNWVTKKQAIESKLNVAQAFSRPTVIFDKSKYHMWFSYRSGSGEKYRIGYSSSSNGENWTPPIRSSLDVSDSGWDSEMVCYPCVFKHKDEIYMIYNGNDYGKTGFGLAILR